MPLADLSAILVVAAEMLSFFRRDDHPDSLAVSGVDVIFDRASPRHFDVVVGPIAFTREATWHSGRKLTSYSISACMSQRSNLGFPWNATT